MVNLLVSRGHPTEDAARATLLDLAARRIIEISQPGIDPLQPVVRVREEGPHGLTAYEQRIFVRVTGAAPGGQIVPLAAVTDAYAQEGFWWWDSFRREVRAEAKKAGYTDNSRFSWSTGILMMGAFCVAMLVSLAALLPFLPTLDPGFTTLIWAAFAVPLWSALGWYAFGLAQRNPAAWAVVAFAAWRLLRNLYVSVRAVVDLAAPATTTGTLLSLRHNVPRPREQEGAPPAAATRQADHIPRAA